MENNFTNTIKNWLIAEIENYKDTNLKTHKYDVASIITETIHVDGSVNCSKYLAIEFIKENFEEFGELVEYHKREFGGDLNPFNEPETAEVIAYICGVEILLNELKCLQKFAEEIILTNDLIKEIVEELEQNHFVINF